MERVHTFRYTLWMKCSMKERKAGVSKEVRGLKTSAHQFCGGFLVNKTNSQEGRPSGRPTIQTHHTNLRGGNMPKIILVLTMFVLIGCQKDRFTNTSAKTWDDRPVALDSVPNNVVPDKLGNIGEHSRVYGVTSAPSEVYVKRTNDGNWEALLHRSDGECTYTDDRATREVRFQYCNSGYGYAIYFTK